MQVDDESLEGLSYGDALKLLRQTEGLVELVVMRPLAEHEYAAVPGAEEMECDEQNDIQLHSSDLAVEEDS